MRSLAHSVERVRGFTLIELIMVLVLLGVLAVFLAPRLNTKDFEARGFHDETLAFLRYAQKTAIAQRRTVCVGFTASTATLSFDPNAGTANCTQSLRGPSGPDQISAPAGTAYLGQPAAALRFNPLGQPSQAVAMQVALSGTPIGPTITVEAETGYVHD